MTVNIGEFFSYVFTFLCGAVIGIFVAAWAWDIRGALSEKRIRGQLEQERKASL